MFVQAALEIMVVQLAHPCLSMHEHGPISTKYFRIFDVFVQAASETMLYAVGLPMFVQART